MAKAGLLRERAVFERMTEGAVDDYGNVYTGWSTLATRWGDLRERTGKETVEGGFLSDKATATLRVRKDSTTEAVTAADRVQMRGATWDILSAIQVDAKGVMMEFLLQRGVAT